jgi:hypothetical protein
MLKGDNWKEGQNKQTNNPAAARAASIAFEFYLSNFYLSKIRADGKARKPQHHRAIACSNK